jgi:hypothetical protein
MPSTNEIDTLLDRIRSTIKASAEGSLSLDKTRHAYKKLLDEYSSLERKYISTQAGGYLKGLLYHHNTFNSANLTAVFIIRNDTPEHLVYAGDRILLNALPDLISRELPGLDQGAAVFVPLGEQDGQTFSMALKRITAGHHPIVVASVTSTTVFNMADFDLLIELLNIIYMKYRDFFSTVMLNYISDISSEISHIFNSGKGGSVHADHFILYIPPGAFARAGIYDLIEFSDFIVSTLKTTYPDSVHIFTLSISNYIVLYDSATKQGLDVNRNRIDFFYGENNIPYKVQITEIDSPQSLYLFLESL